MLRGGVLARFYRPWGWGFELCFARGREFAHQKNCLEGRSGLELTDTLLHVKIKLFTKDCRSQFSDTHFSNFDNWTIPSFH